jgi:RsiW-degrading membrane proteinase PrsW (M82 family)
MEGAVGNEWRGPDRLRPVASRHSGGVLFTVLLSLTLLLGAALIAVVLLLSGAPGAIAVGLVFAALPVGPVVGAFLWLDRYEPEPRNLLGFAFGWGAVVATALALGLQLLDQLAFGTLDTVSAAVTAPLTEEGAKGLFILILLWARRREIDGVLDGIVYAGLVGAGFAFTENILYLAAAYTGGDSGPGGLGQATGLFVVRGIFSPFAHPLFTSAIGVGVGIAVLTRNPATRLLAPLLGYVVAVGAHALWNLSALLGSGSVFVLTYLFAMVPAFLVLAGFAVWARHREGVLLSRSLTDCARRGMIRPADVPWLVRLPARRASRRYAASYGGAPAEKVMRAYQQQAVELGFLHDRWLRGTPPPDLQARAAAMVQVLADLRPYVQFPHEAGTHPLPTALTTRRDGGR